MVCALIASAFSGKNYSPKDFMPEEDEEELLTLEQKQKKLELLNAAYGGEVVIKEDK
ncbi:MAG: hypothetical protein PHU08_04440 [Dehalococcoidales bacterium]|nr:hypothetical protein [Dehalococcoidales bacterium]